jgi:cytochrome c556
LTTPARLSNQNLIPDSEVSMRRVPFVLAWLVGVLTIQPVAAHEDSSELPEGPIRERHELMEGIGRNAKIIGDALKAGDLDKVAGPASQIEKAAGQVPALFPEGSLHPKSRAKPEIWTDPKGFDFEVKKLQAKAASLAVAAEQQDGVPKAANEMFEACKSCHTNFRVPEE